MLPLQFIDQGIEFGRRQVVAVLVVDHDGRGGPAGGPPIGAKPGYFWVGRGVGGGGGLFYGPQEPRHTHKRVWPRGLSSSRKNW